MKVAVIETQEVNDDAGLSVFDDRLTSCSPLTRVVRTKTELRTALHDAVAHFAGGQPDEAKLLVISGHGEPATGGCFQVAEGEVVDWKIDFDGYFSGLPSNTAIFASYCWGAAPCFQHALPRENSPPLVGFLVHIDENHHRELLNDVLDVCERTLPGDGGPFLEPVTSFNERWASFYEAPAARVVFADRTQVPESQGSMTSPRRPRAEAVVVSVNSSPHGGPQWVVVRNRAGHFRVCFQHFDAAASGDPLSLIGRSFRIPCKVVHVPAESAIGMLEVVAPVQQLRAVVTVPDPPYAHCREASSLSANPVQAVLPPSLTMSTCAQCSWASFKDAQTENRARHSFSFCRRGACPEHEKEGVVTADGDADAAWRRLLSEVARRARERHQPS